jgi:hypothetical protein
MKTRQTPSEDRPRPSATSQGVRPDHLQQAICLLSTKRSSELHKNESCPSALLSDQYYFLFLPPSLPPRPRGLSRN